jgi:hypothetical protein
MATPVTVGLLARIEAKPGREADVEDFLHQGLSLVEQEPGTVRWFAIRFGALELRDLRRLPRRRRPPGSPLGPCGPGLGENTGELFEEPTIEQVDVIAERDPQ